MFYMLKRKLMMCTLHPACVEQQPMKIEQDITKSPICVKNVVQSKKSVLKCSIILRILDNKNCVHKNIRSQLAILQAQTKVFSFVILNGGSD